MSVLGGGDVVRTDKTIRTDKTDRTIRKFVRDHLNGPKVIRS